MALLALTVGYGLNARRGQAEQETSAPAEVRSLRAPDGEPTSNGTPGGMGVPQFWQLIADTRGEAGNDTGRQSELLEGRLSELPPAQIVSFGRLRRRLDERAYTWDIWGAAYVIEDGCSKDCFRDFRAYLISLGRGPYEAALRDPDSLAPVVQDAEEGDWENADDVAPDAYGSATSDDYPLDDSDLSGSPRGEPWDDEHQEALVQRYPALAARFR
jgi:hypothetical protein